MCVTSILASSNAVCCLASCHSRRRQQDCLSVFRQGTAGAAYPAGRETVLIDKVELLLTQPMCSMCLYGPLCWLLLLLLLQLSPAPPPCPGHLCWLLVAGLLSWTGRVRHSRAQRKVRAASSTPHLQLYMRSCHSTVLTANPPCSLHPDSIKCPLLLMQNVFSFSCMSCMAAAVKGPAGAARSILPPDTPTDSDTAAAGGSSSSTLSPHVVNIGPPVMYSFFFPDQGSAEAAGLNLRASWLAGHRVYGPVLLAGSGIMRGAVSAAAGCGAQGCVLQRVRGGCWLQIGTQRQPLPTKLESIYAVPHPLDPPTHTSPLLTAPQGTYNVVKWRSYTADTFWAAVSGLLPAAAHSSSRAAHGGCTLTRLPTQYRWAGGTLPALCWLGNKLGLTQHLY